MGVVGAIAFAANLVCFYLLYSHLADNLNMSSTWLCSRNDLIANVGKPEQRSRFRRPCFDAYA
jgi:Co/Zn/Cd efflux system component